MSIHPVTKVTGILDILNKPDSAIHTLVPTVTVSTPKRYWCEFHYFEFIFLTIYCASSKLYGCHIRIDIVRDIL